MTVFVNFLAERTAAISLVLVSFKVEGLGEQMVALLN